MSDEESDDRDSRLPRETTALFGHEEAERALLDAYKSGRIPHAWLIGGAPGIGKATLAFRLARFMFAHPDPKAAVVQKATSLAIDPSHPVARRIATQAQGDLLVLERGLNEQTGKLYTVIRVDDVRRTRHVPRGVGDGLGPRRCAGGEGRRAVHDHRGSRRHGEREVQEIGPDAHSSTPLPAWCGCSRCRRRTVSTGAGHSPHRAVRRLFSRTAPGLGKSPLSRTP